MRHVLKLSFLALPTIVFGSGIAQAIDFAQRSPEFPPREYTCRYNGEDVRLGERRCLQTTRGQKLAECGISLNMSTWRASEGACP